MRVVLDASSFVSAALKSGSIPEQALLRAMSDQNRLLLSADVFAEFQEVLFRPKFDRFASRSQRQRLLDLVLVGAEFVSQLTPVRECVDPKDDKYLALAASGQADVIVSGDVRHLLSMHPWRGIDILAPAAFLALP